MANIDNALLYTTITSLPEELKAEALKFINSLVDKASKKGEKPQPKFGSGKDFFILKPGWDDPLTEEFKDYM